MQKLLLVYLAVLFTGKITAETIKDKTVMNSKTDTATLGGGCFWCTEAVFKELKGVISTMPGYSGGFVKNPAYREVCTGNTGHAEVTRVVFDPAIISYEQILDVFFNTHDPTTLNRQGNDVGSQYRSVIFYNNPEQKEIALKKINELKQSGQYANPVVTAVEPLTNFYEAEEYHHDYFKKNPDQAYCSFIVRPKVDKFRKNYHDMLK